MDKEQIVKSFDSMGGETYDQHNLFFKPIMDNLHFLNSLILKDLPKDARILCVGVGTGADIIELAMANKSWSFVGIDPSKSMLKICKKKLRQLGLIERCELFNGYLADYTTDQKFDGVLCLYVMHFIKDPKERAQMFKDFAQFLKKDGYLINAEISIDINSPNHTQLVENWKTMHGLTGTSTEKLDGIKKQLEEQLGTLSQLETEEMIVKNDFKNPIHFFQSLLIRAWYSRRV